MALMNPNSLWGKRAHRVIPRYPDLVSDYLGVTQKIIAFVLLMLSVVAFLVGTLTSVPACGMALVLPLFLCGLFGVISGIKKETWAIVGYLVLSIIVCILSLFLLIAALAGMAREYQQDSKNSVAVREGIDIGMLAMAVLSGVSSVASMVVSGIFVLKGCCRCIKIESLTPVLRRFCRCIKVCCLKYSRCSRRSKGAKYVSEPNVEFSHSTTPSEIDSHTTVENGYDQHESNGNAITVATIDTIRDNTLANNAFALQTDASRENGHTNNAPLSNSSDTKRTKDGKSKKSDKADLSFNNPLAGESTS